MKSLSVSEQPNRCWELSEEREGGRPGKMSGLEVGLGELPGQRGRPKAQL